LLRRRVSAAGEEARDDRRCRIAICIQGSVDRGGRSNRGQTKEYLSRLLRLAKKRALNCETGLVIEERAAVDASLPLCDSSSDSAATPLPVLVDHLV